MQAAHYMGWMIDTLDYAKGLEEAGVDRKVAEFQAKALAVALRQAADTHFATKEDLRIQKTEILEHMDQRFLEERVITNNEFILVREDIKEMRQDIRKLQFDVTALNGKIETGSVELNGKMETGFSELNGKIEAVRAEVDGKIDRMETRMINRMTAMTISIVTLLGGLMTLFHFV